jgi:hypothetical protein
MSQFTKLDITSVSEAKQASKTTDGNLIIVGKERNTGNDDVLLISTSANDLDAINWHKSINNNSNNLNDVGNSVIVTENNEIVLVGTTGTITNGTDIYLIKRSSNGEIIFEKTFGGSGDETGEKISLTSDGGFIITGSSDYEGNSMILLIKTDSEGNLNN